MYKVMLVDDDYPVLELLAEAIPWSELGLTLAGAYENGSAALEAAERDMPDILVTDIGMPKMDGLELIRRAKERSPSLRVAILSCHGEFEYAKRAMTLQVQDYLLKDTLDPDDLTPVLARLVASLDEERRLRLEQRRLRHMVDRSREAMREKWVQSAAQQPPLRTETWVDELESFGLPATGRIVLPVVGALDDLRSARGRFVSDDVLRFAVTNVIDEVTGSVDAVAFPYSSREWIVLHAFRPTLAVNGYDEARKVLERVQDALRRTLKLSMSFLVGELCEPNEKLKTGMRSLLNGAGQRFYMRPGDIASLRPVRYGDGDVFAHYDEAIEAFRECVMKRDSERLTRNAAAWAERIREAAYRPEAVKDWALKLLLDIRLKHQALHAFRGGARSADSLHKDVAEIGSLLELRDWLTGHLLAAADAVKEGGARTQRAEVLEAFEYVALRLDQRIGLEEVAEHLHLNASYFSRLFKKETGETFIEYVIRTKMERAKELLDQTSHPVVKISELLGYDNQSYFIKLFRGVTGMTPVDYRNRGAGERANGAAKEEAR